MIAAIMTGVIMTGAMTIAAIIFVGSTAGAAMAGQAVQSLAPWSADLRGVNSRLTATDAAGVIVPPGLSSARPLVRSLAARSIAAMIVAE
jgi:hypothetical protein